MAGVLLSLSSTGYNSNEVSRPDGTFVFGQLFPGEYYLRAQLKEYAFQPATQIIPVTEGSAVTFEVRCTRVAWSVFGRVSTITGQPLPKQRVMAVSMEGHKKSVIMEGHKESVSVEGHKESVIMEGHKENVIMEGHKESAVSDVQGKYRIRGLRAGMAYEVKFMSGDHVIPAVHSIAMKREDVEDVNFVVLSESSTPVGVRSAVEV